MTTTESAASDASPHAVVARRLIDGRSWVLAPELSPDGTRVAFVVASTSVDENTVQTRVWLDDRPLTGGDHDSSPVWSPDGRSLAFTSRRGEKQTETTLHVLPVDGPGEVRAVCAMADGIGDLAWSPDGQSLAFTSRTRAGSYDAKDDSWRPPRKIERFFSRLNGEDWIHDRPSHVYVVAADGTDAKPRNLTPGEQQHSGVAWTADSAAVITSAARHDTWDTDFATDLYLVGVSEPDAIRRLTAGDGIHHSPAVSPDGTQVAFLGYDDPRTLGINCRVGVLPVSAVDAPVESITWVSDGHDRQFECVNGGQGPIWVDDAHLLAVAEDRGEQHLHVLTANGSAPPRQITEGPRTVAQVSAAGGLNGDRPAQLATAESTMAHPAELFVNGERRTTVTTLIEQRTLPWEKFTVPTTDGTGEIDAWIMRPADFDPADATKQYPVLLNVHGGPFTQYGEYFFDEAQMQAAAGFVVVLGNPRGGSGRHTDWGTSILGPRHPKHPGTGWGSVDVDDVLAIIDAAVDRYPFCDRNRVGMLGGSYGGFMATWLAGNHGDRFRAFCSERAVNNLESEEWSSDIATAFVTEHGVSHVEDPEEYRRRSPITYVDNITKPMLLIHSEEDWRCPIAQAEELWIALKLRGREVDFYRFPGENHELSRSGSPVHRVQRAEIILDWFTEKLAASTSH